MSGYYMFSTLPHSYSWTNLIWKMSIYYTELSTFIHWRTVIFMPVSYVNYWCFRIVLILLTSLAPDSLSNLIMGEIVLPLTMESSIRTILLPLKFCDNTPNFFATPSCLNLMFGWMKVLPTYRFLHSTSTYGSPHW